MKAGLIGASGYLGAELLRLLAGHPDIELAAAQADSTSGSLLVDLFPSLAGAYEGMRLDVVDAPALDGLDVVFVAVPSGASQEIVRALVGRVGLVVDLGADFRLVDPLAYSRWYGFEHRHPELLKQAVYGLPELNRQALSGASLVAAPGCYVTAACLALAPFLRNGHIFPTGIVVDAASGTSGAGKTPTDLLHHPLANERFAPYGVLTHRHTPEMEQVLGAELLFTPHLAPMTRGILATCYARLTPASSIESSEEATQVLQEAYSSEPFVHVTSALVSTADAYGSNVAHLTARYDIRTGWLVVFAAIDNLVKGGAGQALQAANVALGLVESAGLPLVGLAP
ncbi:MAG: N-acetyl-gamma-glutamyl-phosphate reductase [Acidimicrobiales bacterium]